jgi:[ribosomal protein S18]-alanine N-acetyltransferase
MVRPGCAADLEAIAAIQAECPEAAHWNAAGYFGYDLLVAIVDGGRIVGFLVSRKTAPDESEILNLAVAPGFRRCGIGRELISAFVKRSPGDIFLEVRRANQIARNLYKSMGFREIAVRREYYDQPPDDGVVMNFHSC